MERTERTFMIMTNMIDPELQFIDVLVQAFSSPSLSNGQRWRALDYLNQRFGQGRAPIPYGDQGGPDGR